MSIVLDANASPTGEVDARLDGYHCSFRQMSLRDTRQSRSFVHLDAQSVAQAMAECFTKSARGECIPGYGIGLLTGHPRRDQRPGSLVCFFHRFVNVPLPLRRPTDNHSSCNVGAIALEHRPEIQQHEVALRNRTIAGTCVGKRTPLSGSDYRAERKSV